MRKKATFKTSQFSFFSRLLIVLIFFLALAQVFMANSLSVQGREISRLEGFRADIEKEVGRLEQKSASLSSLENIRTLAKQKLSMVEGFDSFDYVGHSVALR